MTDVTFAVVDIEPETYAVTPVLNARLGIAAVGDDPIHAIALRCQVRIEPMRRGYTDEEAAGSAQVSVGPAPCTTSNGCRPPRWCRGSAAPRR